METLGRRRWIRLALAGAAGAVVAEALTGLACAPAPPAGPAVVSLPLDALPSGGRTVVQVGKVPVEVRREGDRVLARSLVCPHQGCTVQWREAERRYKCPCQDAWFDESGRPLKGPTDKPLPDVPVDVSGGTATVREP